jgi:hypothetical protein
MVSATVETRSDVVAQPVEDEKRELERQMEESRESIAHTVADIKDAVADEYQSIKQGIGDTLDWREQFRKHPVAWVVGALSVGYVVGNSLGAAYRGTKSEDELLSHLAALGEKFTSELSKRGMNILAPALTGTVLVPILTSQLERTFGIDLSDLPGQLIDDLQTPNPKNGKSKSKKKNRKKDKSGKNSRRGKKSRTKVSY